MKKNNKTLSIKEIDEIFSNKLSSEVIENMFHKGIFFEEGLEQNDFIDIEKIYKVKLPSDFKEFYSKILSIGNKFYNWRDFSERNIIYIKEAMTNTILSGILFDVEFNDFWYKQWGRKPKMFESQSKVVCDAFFKAPKLIPISGTRYMPEEIIENNNYPIISIVQTDIIYYGYNFFDYLNREFSNENNSDRTIFTYSKIPFWTNLILEK